MNPIALLIPMAAAGGAFWLYKQKANAGPRPSDSPSAFKPSPYMPPLLGPTVQGLKPGDVVLARVPQPNESLADMHVEILSVASPGLYNVRGRNDVDQFEASWGMVYPTQVGDADIIWQTNAQGQRLNPDGSVNTSFAGETFFRGPVGIGGQTFYRGPVGIGSMNRGRTPPKANDWDRIVHARLAKKAAYARKLGW